MLRPVRMLARQGLHFGFEVKAFLNSTPSRATRSKFGVSSSGLPWTPVLSQRCWSVKKTTTFGRSVLAAAEDPWRAALTGVNVRLTLATSWAVGGALAGLAGLLLAPVIGVFPTMGADVIFPAFIAAILGGFSSIAGALIGGLLLGLIQTYAVVYLGGALKDVATFAFLLAVLLWRPSGLLRMATARRV